MMNAEQTRSKFSWHMYFRMIAVVICLDIWIESIVFKAQASLLSIPPLPVLRKLSKVSLLPLSGLRPSFLDHISQDGAVCRRRDQNSTVISRC